MKILLWTDLRSRATFILLFPLLMLLNGAVIAADKPAIAYVDARKVLLESKMGKKNKASLEKLVKEKETVLRKEEEKLKTMQEAFQKEQLLMTDNQKVAKQRAFQEKAEAYQKLVRDSRQDINKKDNEYTAKSLAEVRTVIADLAKEMKLILVLETSESGLLYADEGMDLTSKVIEKYDSKSR